MSYSKVIIIGNLCRDPELRFTPKGAAICSLSVAVNRKWKSEAGEEKEEVSFIDVTAFGKQAENVGKFFTKGKPIFIEGRLRQENWDDKATGQKRSKLGVVMEAFQFVGGKESQPARPPYSEFPTRPTAKPDDKLPCEKPGFAAEDDVPF